MVVGVSVELGSRGGSDKGVIVGSGNEMVTRVPDELGSSGGNDSEIEGSGSWIGCGLTVGSEKAGVLESYPSSPGYQITCILQSLWIRMLKRDGSLTPDSQPVGESSQKKGRDDSLESHDFERNS